MRHTEAVRFHRMVRSKVNATNIPCNNHSTVNISVKLRSNLEINHSSPLPTEALATESLAGTRDNKV